MTRIRIMQGRLLPPMEGRFQSFPRGRWREEIASSREAGLDGIEWIYDTFGEGHNPIETAEGRQLLMRLCADHHVIVDSVCADYFLDKPLLRAHGDDRDKLEHRLHELVTQCGSLRIRYIVLPFVDASRIESDADAAEVASILLRVIPMAEQSNVELHLETSLSPRRFAALLAQVDHPLIRVNYDSGNSASLGYLPAEEFDCFGGRVGSVHIKDRVKGGGTVPLGSGDADFAGLFACLRATGYQGDYVLQVARDRDGNELQWARANAAWLRDQFAKHQLG